jgi:hypothetical protein
MTFNKNARNTIMFCSGFCLPRLLPGTLPIQPKQLSWDSGVYFAQRENCSIAWVPRGKLVPLHRDNHVKITVSDESIPEFALVDMDIESQAKGTNQMLLQAPSVTTQQDVL